MSSFHRNLPASSPRMTMSMNYPMAIDFPGYNQKVPPTPTGDYTVPGTPR